METRPAPVSAPPWKSGSPAIEARNISKSFGPTRALSGVDLVASSGQVLALLGPNGAGKTTLVRILTTLLRPDGGEAIIAGYDVVRDATSVRATIGVTGQFAAIDPLLTGREHLGMVGALCHLRPRAIDARVDELLEEFDLRGAADRQAKTYSGGMRRRLDLAASLVAKPEVLVLDEPTTGLDPRTRAAVWDAVEHLVAEGTTVLLTTQYLEEADRLAHRIALIDHGRIVSEGSPGELKARLGGDQIEVQLRNGEEIDAAVAALSGVHECQTIDRDRQRISLPATDGMATMRAVLGQLDLSGIAVDDIAIRRPSLDDVFLALTGREAQHDSSQLPGDDVHALPPAAVPADVAGAPSSSRRPGGSRVRGRNAGGTVVRDSWTIGRRNVRRILRTPRFLLVSSIQPVVYVLMFRYVFGGSIKIPGMSYIDYLLPGILVSATLMGATTAVAMATDLSGGMIERFQSLPIARSAVLAGRCVADLLRSVAVVALVLIVGLILGFQFHSPPLAVLGAMGLVVAISLAFICLYAFVGLLVKDPETAHLAAFLPTMGLIFASSVFVRVENMPNWLQIFARNQPVSLTVDAVRALSEGGASATFVWQAIAWIIGSVVVFGWLAVTLYRRV